MKSRKMVFSGIIFLIISVIMVSTATFAYFTDRATVAREAHIGYIDVHVEKTSNEDDYFLTSWSPQDIGANIYNLGDKSIDVKYVITFTSDDTDYDNFTLSQHDTPLVGTDDSGSRIYEHTVTLNGYGEVAETEDEGINTSAASPYCPDIVFTYNGDSATSVNVKVQIYAKQHRNTSEFELIDEYES